MICFKSLLIKSYIITILFVVLAESVLAEEASDPSLLTLERIFSSDEFKPEKFGPARWLEDGSGYTTLEDSKSLESGKDIVRYEPESAAREVLVSAENLIPPCETKPLDINDYSWSEDGNKLLIFTNTKRVWRENTRGDYWLLDLKNHQLHKLGGDAEPSTLMFAKFSPDSRFVAYVCQRNLYVQYLKTWHIKQLTKNGSNRIINGTSDWVYEEEFRLRDGFRWSPDSKSIAYWQFDTDKTRDFHLINYTDSLSGWGGAYL
ncbi:MAG: DPP IV N-terminal domain-containing protein [Planctomycetota bacterium]|jgi:dipeptidyl-peptidase-4